MQEGKRQLNGLAISEVDRIVRGRASSYKAYNFPPAVRNWGFVRQAHAAVDDYTSLQAVAFFVRQLRTQHPDRTKPLVILMDNLISHLCLVVRMYLMEHNILPVYLPPHT